ncbi:MAG TPA: FmdE family protein [Candidatus Manganitrophaceae bacterium]|nr:FmdE family protein [Candidatus Manganitrophaceae bacterium]
MKRLEEYVEAGAKEGAVRSGIILGIRMALLGLTELGIDDPFLERRSLIVFVEIDRCLPDALQLVTGCRLGNRTLKFKDLGKFAATFVALKTGRAVRIAAKESANRLAIETFPDRPREEALQFAYRRWSDDDLFARQSVRLSLASEALPGARAPRIVCAGCGEGISLGRELLLDQTTVCRSCAGERYFEAM